MNTDAYIEPRRQAMRSPIAGSLWGKGTELLTQLLLIALLPRMLGPSAYGQFAVALALVTMGTGALGLGGSTVMARYVPAAAPSDRAALVRALVHLFARGRVLQLAAVSVVAGVLALLFPERFPPLSTALVLLALAIGAAATLVFQAGLGLGRTDLWSFRFAVQNALLIAAVVVLHELWGTDGALAGIVVASAGTFVFGTLAVFPTLRGEGTEFKVPPGTSRFGMLEALSGLLVLASQRGAVVVVALLAGTTEAGFAALAVGAALVVTVTIGQTFLVQLPSLAERWATHAPQAEATARRLAWQALAVVAPLSLIGALTVDRVVRWLWGQPFSSAEPAFGPALALIPLAPLVALTTQAAALRLRPGARLAASAAGALVFLATALSTVPVWGATGASAALLAGVVATVLVSTRAFPAALTPRLVTASLAASALTLAVGLAT